MANIIEKLFNGDKKILKSLEAVANKVDTLKGDMENLSDEELKNKTSEFRNRLDNGETLSDIKIEAYAVAREASKRVNSEFPYLVQIMGAEAMFNGDIAEMKTGEGKTLTSVLAVYLYALEGKGVHVVTVNEYLAARDAEWMGRIYNFLGLSVGINKRELGKSGKKKVYASDIVYTTNAELGFDYLRDNMVTRVEDRVMGQLNVAIVDEVDSILIDESRTPLIISGGQKQTANLYKQADHFVKKLKEEDYEIDEKSKSIRLTESGVEKAERAFKIKNLYELDHTQLVHHISQALRANYIMNKEVEYVVQDGDVVIVDQFTGRLMKGRAYSDGLHQAIEAKEGVTIKQETATLATITYQNFFRLYNKLCGMTGTAKTEEEEFLATYNMRVIEIPTNRAIARIDYKDAVFGTQEAKFKAIVDVIEELHTKGQPVLVGTISVETSQLISTLLKKHKIKHEVLNAKNHEREADIIAKAGQVGSVTIATNMAGRGTDIKLSDESKQLGGLAVVGTERHESRRIDNQLRGRSGRQGDPGCSKFFVSFKDDLMIRFGGEKAKRVLNSALGDQPIESGMITKMITSAQKKVEGHNYDIRKSLLEYDDVLRQQREIMYEQRNYILENEDAHDIVKTMYKDIINSVVNAHLYNVKKVEDIDFEEILTGLEVLGLDKTNFNLSNMKNLELEEMRNYINDTAWNSYENKINDIFSEFARFEKEIVLRIMDRNWIDHIDSMDKLRNGIHLRSYAQDNPLQAYIKESFEMYDDMLNKTSREVVLFLNRVEIKRKEN